MNTLLTVKNISKTYQKSNVKAVSNVSFNVNSGDIVAFLGSNGAGKTTTLKVILNLVSPDQGKIFFNGQDVTHNNLLLLKNSGTLLEGSQNMFFALSPIENFVYLGGQRGLSRKDAKKNGLAIMEKFNLIEKKNTPVAELSRGMQQIVGVCCALIAKPKLLILDEPTLGLDLNSTKTMIKMLQFSASKGAGIIVTTHQLDFAQRVANRILLINHGKLVLSDDIKNRLEQLNQQTIFLLKLSRAISENEKDKIVALCKLKSITQNNYQISVENQKDLPQVLKILSELPIENLQTRTKDLNDIFEDYARD
ncbi:ABC transporter ATP-binding protein [Lactobacillus hamsteri]|uniref:ABC superfamily ATP binding cassette transporter, ABC protein n=1 Tax=Lactobacillus hamsteri DSM 5661 = JCM 6256 TaxID=1423754 RepID=A0A0R1YJR5_9LACO|nr:ABC transporter ATP-binding protein [Lactobacillus hamsteri]KRM40121.1 ABC superfamily ATP binding cassette transporter, ABC protein [Lactobacillus hamsteri DSM 5661 = JCM 6256]